MIGQRGVLTACRIITASSIVSDCIGTAARISTAVVADCAATAAAAAAALVIAVIADCVRRF